MSEHRDKPHVLIIEGEGEDRDWRVVHPATCPWNAYRSYEPGALTFSMEPPTGPWQFIRACMTQYDIDHNGLDSLACDHLVPKEIRAAPGFSSYESWRHIPAGRYTIECWSEWSGSMFDDADGGMDLIEAPEDEPTEAVASCHEAHSAHPSER